MPVLQAAKEGRAEFIVIGIGSALNVPQHGQLLGVRHRQRSQQQSIDQREDRCVRAHAKSQRQQRHGRKARRL